jgi:hypothetical protein
MKSLNNIKIPCITAMNSSKKTVSLIRILSKSYMHYEERQIRILNRKVSKIRKPQKSLRNNESRSYIEILMLYPNTTA